MKIGKNMKKSFHGIIFSEIVEINGKKFEHLGFKDDKGTLGDFLAKNVGKRVKVTFEFKEKKEK